MADVDFTLADARSALTYNPDTGELRWTPEARQSRKRDVAGSLATNGYVMIRIGGKLRLGHRLAWFLHYGQWPSTHIDHINGNRADNRLANLRDVPHAANMRNRKDAPMLVGAIPAGNGKWRAAVHQYGGAEDLGEEYDSPEQANAAWLRQKAGITNPNEPRPMLRKHRLVSRLLKS